MKDSVRQVYLSGSTSDVTQFVLPKGKNQSVTTTPTPPITPRHHSSVVEDSFQQVSSAAEDHCGTKTVDALSMSQASADVSQYFNSSFDQSGHYNIVKSQQKMPVVSESELNGKNSLGSSSFVDEIKPLSVERSFEQTGCAPSLAQDQSSHAGFGNSAATLCSNFTFPFSPPLSNGLSTQSCLPTPAASSFSLSSLCSPLQSTNGFASVPLEIHRVGYLDPSYNSRNNETLSASDGAKMELKNFSKCNNNSNSASATVFRTDAANLTYSSRVFMNPVSAAPVEEQGVFLSMIPPDVPPAQKNDEKELIVPTMQDFQSPTGQKEDCHSLDRMEPPNQSLVNCIYGEVLVHGNMYTVLAGGYSADSFSGTSSNSSSVRRESRGSMGPSGPRPPRLLCWALTRYALAHFRPLPPTPLISTARQGSEAHSSLTNPGGAVRLTDLAGIKLIRCPVSRPAAAAVAASAGNGGAVSFVDGMPTRLLIEIITTQGDRFWIYAPAATVYPGLGGGDAVTKMWWGILSHSLIQAGNGAAVGPSLMDSGKDQGHEMTMTTKPENVPNQSVPYVSTRRDSAPPGMISSIRSLLAPVKANFDIGENSFPTESSEIPTNSSGSKQMRRDLKGPLRIDTNLSYAQARPPIPPEFTNVASKITTPTVPSVNIQTPPQSVLSQSAILPDAPIKAPVIMAPPTGSSVPAPADAALAQTIAHQAIFGGLMNLSMSSKGRFLLVHPPLAERIGPASNRLRQVCAKRRTDGPSHRSMSPPPPGTTFERYYKTLSMIGFGGFSFVNWVCPREEMSDSTGQYPKKLIAKFFIKSKIRHYCLVPWPESLDSHGYPTSSPMDNHVDSSPVPRGFRRLPLEIAAVMNLDHPGIARAVEFWESPTHYIMVMEPYGTGKDLFEFIERVNANAPAGTRGVPEKLARRIFSQIAEAVNYLHSRGLVHGDVKDENVIVDRMPGVSGSLQDVRVKLIDFGSCSPFEFADPAGAMASIENNRLKSQEKVSSGGFISRGKKKSLQVESKESESSQQTHGSTLPADDMPIFAIAESGCFMLESFNGRNAALSQGQDTQSSSATAFMSGPQSARPSQNKQGFFGNFASKLSSLRDRHNNVSTSSMLTNSSGGSSGAISHLNNSQASMTSSGVEIPLFTRYHGTAKNSSPEVQRREPYNPFSQEIWSLGVLLYTLLFGEDPAYPYPSSQMSSPVAEVSAAGSSAGAANSLPAVGKILTPPHENPILASVSSSSSVLTTACKHLLSRMLEPNWKLRATMEEILRHPWLEQARSSAGR